MSPPITATAHGGGKYSDRKLLCMNIAPAYRPLSVPDTCALRCRVDVSSDDKTRPRGRRPSISISLSAAVATFMKKLMKSPRLEFQSSPVGISSSFPLAAAANPKGCEGHDRKTFG